MSVAGKTRNVEATPEALIAYVQRSLMMGIITGRFKSGERLSPSLIARELGVSHIPVREALVALEAGGHVEHRPRIGFSIPPLSYGDLSDIYRLRKVLEDEAHAIAVPMLTDDEVGHMDALCSQMSTLARTGRRQEYLILNREFHFVVFDRVGSDLLLRMINGLWDAAARYPAASLVSTADAHQEHLELMNAVRDRDVDAANEIMDRHRARSLTAVAQLDRLSSTDDR